MFVFVMDFNELSDILALHMHARTTISLYRFTAHCLAISSISKKINLMRTCRFMNNDRQLPAACTTVSNGEYWILSSLQLETLPLTTTYNRHDINSQGLHKSCAVNECIIALSSYMKNWWMQRLRCVYAMFIVYVNQTMQCWLAGIT